MQFAAIPGHDVLKHTLTQAVRQNHVAHAQLFAGSAGSAVFPLAWAYIQFLYCEQPTENDSCGVCASCQKVSKWSHPDLTVLFPTAGGKKVSSDQFLPIWRTFTDQKPFAGLPDWLHEAEFKQGNIPVEEARQLLSKLSLKPYEGRYKMVLIWSAESLHTATANALLKLLEEPPDETLFFLVSFEPEKILPTILSRTQRIQVGPFQDQDIQHYLVEKAFVPVLRAEELAFQAHGDLHVALHSIHQEGPSQHAFFSQWMRYCYGFLVDKWVVLADEFDQMTKEEQKQMLDYALAMFRELLLGTYADASLTRLTGERLTFLTKFAQAIQTDQLESVVLCLNEAYVHIERNVRAKIVFLDSCWQLSQLIR